MRSDLDEQRRQLSEAHQALADRALTISALLDTVADLRAALPDAAALARDVSAASGEVERLRSVVERAPVQMTIDASGHLVVFRACGDLERIGRVVSPPAAAVDEIEMVAGGLRFRMTDGRLHHVALPQAVATPGVDIDEADIATAMLEGTVRSYGQIGQRYGISTRKVAQIVRDARSAEASHDG